ncbi:hypothetical protein KEM48_010886 [Puccinia striiformis f. sp. tritici PST-130]|nr:hypothetical protein KEM48_010886 [Puccinia striiformis f. sp. tritici PST-130]
METDHNAIVIQGKIRAGDEEELVYGNQHHRTDLNNRDLGSTDDNSLTIHAFKQTREETLRKVTYLINCIKRQIHLGRETIVFHMKSCRSIPSRRRSRRCFSIRAMAVHQILYLFELSQTALQHKTRAIKWMLRQLFR